MSIAERLLLALSRAPGERDYQDATDGWTLDTAIEPLKHVFPNLLDIVRDARVLDFGCGSGWQAAALGLNGAAQVLGVDTNTSVLRKAAARARELGCGDKVSFSETIPEELQHTFDVVISQNAMEHFSDPEAILRLMMTALRPGGRLLVTFGPPWFAPTGSHMHFFTRVPWVNLLFPESAVMAARAHFRSDGAKRYEDVESGLNRMSVAKFERLTAKCGMRMEERRYQCVKGFNFLGKLPVLRELFINNISCILVPTGQQQSRAAQSKEYALLAT